MTHLVVSEGALWVIKCGHKFTQNADRTFFPPFHYNQWGTSESWLTPHSKLRVELSV